MATDEKEKERQERKKTRNLVGILCFFVLFKLACAPAGPPALARDFQVRGTPLPLGFGAYGYLVFTKRPGRDQANRYGSMCEAYVNALESVNTFPGRDRASLMVTYWLLEEEPTNEWDLPDCMYLLEQYDYATASTIASSIGVLDAEGPVLVAWRTPFETHEPGDTRLLLDLSTFIDNDLDRAFGIWKSRIVRDPTSWEEGFVLSNIKERFRNFLQKYGPSIVSVIEPSLKGQGEVEG